MGRKKPSTKLLEVFQKVPQLRQCCANILNDPVQKLCGVKILRHVSKAFRDTMTQDVDGYGLKIRSRLTLSQRDPKTALQPRESWDFLCKFPLLRLRVEVDDEDSWTPQKGVIFGHLFAGILIILMVQGSRHRGRS